MDYCDVPFVSYVPVKEGKERNLIPLCCRIGMAEFCPYAGPKIRGIVSCSRKSMLDLEKKMKNDGDEESASLIEDILDDKSKHLKTVQ